MLVVDKLYYFFRTDYIVYAELDNALKPDEYCDYDFSVSKPSAVQVVSKEGNKFQFFITEEIPLLVTVKYTIYKYNNTDFTKTIVKEITESVVVNPSEESVKLPDFGNDYNLDPEIKHKLDYGIQKLKEIPPLANIKVPPNVWEYVTLEERDKLISAIYDSFMYHRNPSQFMYYETSLLNWLTIKSNYYRSSYTTADERITFEKTEGANIYYYAYTSYSKMSINTQNDLIGPKYASIIFSDLGITDCETISLEYRTYKIHQNSGLVRIFVNDIELWNSTMDTDPNYELIELDVSEIDNVNTIKIMVDFPEDITAYCAFYFRNINFKCNAAISMEEAFAMTYIWHLLNIWYYETPEDEKPSINDLNADYIATNWGISNLIENSELNEETGVITKTFSINLGDYYDKRDMKLELEIESGYYYISKSRVHYINTGYDNYIEIRLGDPINLPSEILEPTYLHDPAGGYYQNFYVFRKKDITEKPITFYTDIITDEPSMYEIPYYVTIVADNDGGSTPFTYEWQIETEGDYIAVENDDTLSLAILTPDVDYITTCTIVDSTGYTKIVKKITRLNSDLPKPITNITNTKIKHNYFKGTISLPFDIPEEDKQTIIDEINIHMTYDMRLILSYLKQKAVNKNYKAKITVPKDFKENNKYMLYGVSFEGNKIAFYLRCTSDYSPNTATKILYNLICYILNLNGYKKNMSVITFNLEPVFNSEQIVQDMEEYLSKVWSSKYNDIYLFDIYEILKKEVDVFIENLR